MIGKDSAVSIVQNNRQQGLVDFDSAVGFDKAEFSKFIHKTIHAGTRGPDHFRKRLLGNVWEQAIWMFSLPVAGEQEQGSGQAFLNRVEELIDQIFFHANVVGEHVRDKMVG